MWILLVYEIFCIIFHEYFLNLYLFDVWLIGVDVRVVSPEDGNR